jgi:hypothetical protein
MAKFSRRSRIEEKCENLLVENMLKIPDFLKALDQTTILFWGFYVSEGLTAFLCRTIEVPCLDAPVTGGNINCNMGLPELI